MKKTFYFIRHGQTDLNLKGIVQGRGVDSPLNDNGLKQAQAFYDSYKNVPFDKIYTSTLIRTHQTVAPFLKNGVPMEQLIGLDEISWGIYEGQEQTEDILSGFEKVVNSWRNNDLDLAIENGESPNALVYRQKEAIDYMLQQPEEETILVCMHGRALRIMLCHLTDVPVCKMDDFPHTNTALYKLEFADNNFSIVDYYNTKHLEGLLNE
ncbi:MULTISPECIES: histidine phosphatase family protein [Sphingobacterium]|uniref:histidine phosphatase family protein n=1 Tax=Sphingobacterium TaxID=28453 RepID=UPI000B93D630|nr:MULTISPECIES: histidine phosphatase family protein [Sphingobacterium]OYD41089.1 histidine phosphatase family protein [Sphingobacterium cellulitidis]OYD44223.1 histidine phosphatase family protein [Sphingobacterium cellulitidis]WFB65100.1 histidine phosphatase family protein [Sphingobacterium sp. WM]